MSLRSPGSILLSRRIQKTVILNGFSPVVVFHDSHSYLPLVRSLLTHVSKETSFSCRDTRPFKKVNSQYTRPYTFPFVRVIPELSRSGP